MTARNLLAKTRLADFCRWCLEQGIEVLPPRGQYEAVRILTGEGESPIYTRDKGPHLTILKAVEPLVEAWMEPRRAEARPKKQERLHAEHQRQVQLRPAPESVQPPGGGSEDPPW
ncbi:MAG TPA: hypothetical protein PKW90_28390 [Myxococcota bacterium]|nr:hypothetical protein [Myxococcota bacterium]